MRTIGLLLLVLPCMAFGRSSRLYFIQEHVASIDADSSLTIDTLDLAAIGEWPDGGGAITYYYRGRHLVKIEEDHYPSYGRARTQYYFREDTLMLVRDREDHHPWLPDSTGLDRTRLVKQFEASYYMWTVEVDLARDQYGVRVLSEGPCGNLEWEPSVQHLIEQAPRRP
jgi:hypothetical protein